MSISLILFFAILGIALIGVAVMARNIDSLFSDVPTEVRNVLKRGRWE